LPNLRFVRSKVKFPRVDDWSLLEATHGVTMDATYDGQVPEYMLHIIYI